MWASGGAFQASNLQQSAYAASGKKAQVNQVCSFDKEEAGFFAWLY
jgi:hypothetical protein